MKRILSALTLVCALSLGACAVPSASIESDAQALLTAAEANGSISAADGLIAQEVITGFEAISGATASSLGDGDSVMLASAKSLSAAITQLTADDTNATVVADAKTAQGLLNDIINASTTAVTQADLEVAVANFLIDYLATHGTAGAAAGSTSPTAALINDARARIAALR